MKDRGTIGSRLRDARKERGFTLEKVGKFFEITPQAVQQWEKDVTVPDAERLDRLAKLLEVDVGYILTGAVLLEHTGNISVRSVFHLGGRAVPRLTLKDVTEQRFYASGGNYLHTHFPCSEGSYAITIEDASCADEYMQGDSVVIDPDLRPDPGDMVLAVVNGEAIFRRFKLVSKNPLQFLLEPLNPLWAPDTGTDLSVILGVMSEHTKPRRR